MKDSRVSILFALLGVFAFGMILSGCGSDDEPPVSFPPQDELRVAYISSAQAPAIDGQASEAVWETAQLSQLIALEDSENNPKGRVALLELKALSDSTNFYMYARWRDEGGVDDRYRQWQWSSSGGPDPWRKDLAREDVLTVLFEGETDTSSTMGCNRFCHELGVGSYEFINKTGSAVDGWFWRATQTNPIGYALDLNFQDTIYADSGTLGLDQEDMSGFIVNEIENGGQAAWWNDSIKIDTIIFAVDQDTATIIDTLYRVDIGNSLFASDTVAFSPQLIVDSIYIPAFVLSTSASGDRWDVQAKAVYDIASKYWTLELKRAMNTGHAEDIVFAPGSEIKANFGVGVDFMQSHIGYDPILIKF